MGEGKRIGVEHLAVGFEVCLLFEADVLFAAIDTVSGEREAEVLKVDADLMGATSVEDDLDKGCVAESFEDAVAGASFPTFSRFGDGHGSAARGMAADGGADFSAWG